MKDEPKRVGGEEPPHGSLHVCADCLRRTWLVERLGGHLERAREQGRRLPLVLGLSDDELIAALGGGEADRLRAERARFDAPEAAVAITRAGLAAVCRCSPAYPDTLRAGPDAPAVIHVFAVPSTAPLGNGEPASVDAFARLDDLAGAPSVAIVGARRASAEGIEVARALGRGLSAAGVTVVSGLALGIDAAAHEGALEAGGRTMAVLAAGAGRAYPASRRHLHRRIAAAGAVVSEMPPDARIWRWAFPARNRIIAALASLTVVVEGTERSGSLITAGLAEDLGRDVAAVPGRVTSPLASGPNALIKAGAHLVRDAADVLDLALGVGTWAAPAPPEPPGGDLGRLLAAVGAGRDTVGRLVTPRRPVERVLAGVAALELEGWVRRAPGGRIVVAPR
jgi:DNA processing protein